MVSRDARVTAPVYCIPATKIHLLFLQTTVFTSLYSSINPRGALGTLLTELNKSDVEIFKNKRDVLK